MTEVESFQIGFKQTITPRVKDLYEGAVSVYPSVCSERARYWTESWKETEGQPAVLRRAKALANVLKKMSIYILDGELVVGNVASKPRGSVVNPEYSTNILYEEFQDSEKSPDVRKYDNHNMSMEVRKELMEDIFPYWLDKTIEYNVLKDLSKETIHAAIPSLSDVSTVPPGTEIHLRHGAGHLTVDYQKMIEKGAIGIIEEVNGYLCKTDNNETDKIDFYKSVIIIYKAFIEWANRYSDLAMELEKKETDSMRKKELYEIAQICRNVPAHPAKNFREAIQCFWFTQIVLFGLEQDSTAVSPGRMDQYLYPYYQKDIKLGITSEEDVLELIELLFIKTAHMSVLWDFTTAKYYAGFSLTQTIIVGGVDIHGIDATNELSYLFLEAEKQVGLFQPEFAVRIHKDSPYEFLLKIAEVVRMGHGKPKIFVDESGIPMMLKRGSTLEEARDYCIVGCVEPSIPGKIFGWTNAAQFNLAKCMELALNSGICILTNKQIGPKTQDPETFESIDEVIEAYKQQVEFFVKHMVKATSAYVYYHGKYAQNPFTSSLIDGCLQQGIDGTAGGAKYKAIGVNGVAAPDVGDSLAAIEKLVFIDKAVSMASLIRAIRADFEGEEDLRLLLLNRAPKYGNDDSFVDNFVRKVGQLWCSEVEKHKGPHGEQYYPGIFTVSANVPYGLTTAALPSGRKSKEPLANGGISAANGSDMMGPTALLRSASKVDHLDACNGTLLNMRFSPSVLKEERDLNKFANFLKAYTLMGGFHVQFNVVSSSLLKKAQENPDGYQNLLVRVAGYSAYFTELSPEVQQDLINRTEHSEVG